MGILGLRECEAHRYPVFEKLDKCSHKSFLPALWLIFRQSHPNFILFTHRVHLRNLGTTDKNLVTK